MTVYLENDLKTERNRIESELKSLIMRDKKRLPSTLFEAVSYSLLGNGKRLRPLLTLITCEVLGKDPSLALIPACALEMIHTYSIIHDDLPCMDDDDFRRGKPSLHRAYKEGIAVLAGDFLLTYPFELIATCSHLEDNQRLSLIKELSQAAGGAGMIGGQVDDLETEKQAPSLAALKDLYAKKTGALFCCSVRFGTIIAKAEQQEQKALEEFAAALGLGYQILDDLQDSAFDGAHAKATYPALSTVEAARQTVVQLHKEAKNALCQLPKDSTRLENLLNALLG